MPKWRGIEVENWCDWNKIAEEVFHGHVLHPFLCPSCGGGPLRYFYWRYEDEEDEDDHARRVSRGGQWIWCPSCCRFEHASGRVPTWWQNPKGVPFEELKHDPDWLDKHWDNIKSVREGS